MLANNLEGYIKMFTEVVWFFLCVIGMVATWAVMLQAMAEMREAREGLARHVHRVENMLYAFRLREQGRQSEQQEQARAFDASNKGKFK